MTPILIDNRDLIKIGFSTIIITALVFSGGIFFGYQQAAGFYQYRSMVKALTLPEVPVNLRDQQIPGVIVAGENIDVDQAEAESQKSVQPSTNSIISDTTASASSANGGQSQASAEANDAIESKSDKTLSESINKQAVHPGTHPEAEESISELQADAEPADNTEMTSIDFDKVKYSIQVGMYGSLANATNMMKMLQVQQLDSYVSNYKNRKNEPRYNVRFGYFLDKKTAITKLNDYKSKVKGDGYLVRFSGDNIVNPANAENAEFSVNVDEKINKKLTGKPEVQENRTLPEIAPLELKLNKFSQANILNL
jgi:cell division septation protein DedD